MIRTKVLTAAAVGAALALTLAGCSAERGSSSSTSEAAAATTAATSAASAAAGSGSAAASASGAASGSAAAGGCTSAGGELIGVTMPTSSSQRWIQDGDNVKKQLEAAGYKVDLQYAENDIPTQVNQVDNQITNGAKVLIIASIDGTALTSQLQNAADNDIKVIAYDRLIREQPERRLLRHLRQRTGRRRSGELPAGRPGSAERGRLCRHRDRTRSTSNCSPDPRTTTTPPSSSTGPCPCCSRSSTRAPSW